MMKIFETSEVKLARFIEPTVWAIKPHSLSESANSHKQICILQVASFDGAGVIRDGLKLMDEWCISYSGIVLSSFRDLSFSSQYLLSCIGEGASSSPSLCTVVLTKCAKTQRRRTAPEWRLAGMQQHESEGRQNV